MKRIILCVAILASVVTVWSQEAVSVRDLVRDSRTAMEAGNLDLAHQIAGNDLVDRQARAIHRNGAQTEPALGKRASVPTQFAGDVVGRADEEGEKRDDRRGERIERPHRVDERQSDRDDADEPGRPELF